MELLPKTDVMGKFGVYFARGIPLLAVELDLSDGEPSLAGPRRPQDRVPLASAKESFLGALDTFGVAYPNGSPDKALEDTFPASDPTAEQQPGGVPEWVEDAVTTHV